jgi:uncharacterized membrane protein
MTVVRRSLEAVENVDALDVPSEAIQAKLRAWVGDTPVERVLGGAWLGHPVHPIGVQVPIGLWLAAAVLDLDGRHDDGARRLVGAGLLAVPPAVAAGLVDWSVLTPRQRRVGVVHAAVNAVASACFAASYRCRRGGRRTAGRMWTLLGLGAVGIGGALGGHLAYSQGAGVYRWSRPRS